MRRTFKQTVCEAVMLLWKDIKDMRWAIMVIIAYFALGWKYLYSLCPVVVITGFPCPGCGLTRAGIRLIRLDFAGAYQIHPFIYAIAGYMAVFCWNRYIKKFKMGEKLKILLILLIIFMFIFYIWRLFKDFPEKSPMIYYDNNLLKSLRKII